LEAARNLTELEKQHFGFVLAWFESWRLKLGIALNRESAVRFWKEVVKAKPRKPWQLDRWAEAMRWQAKWLSACVADGRDPQSLGERMHRAVMQVEIAG
jgi:hypothetical protein